MNIITARPSCPWRRWQPAGVLLGGAGPQAASEVKRGWQRVLGVWEGASVARSAGPGIRGVSYDL
jgi:hypothetical protein